MEAKIKKKAQNQLSVGTPIAIVTVQRWPRPTLIASQTIQPRDQQSIKHVVISVARLALLCVA